MIQHHTPTRLLTWHESFVGTPVQQGGCFGNIYVSADLVD